MPTRFALVAVAVLSSASVTAAQTPAVSADTAVARRLARIEREVDSLRQVARRHDATLAARTTGAARADEAIEPLPRPAVAAGAVYAHPSAHRLGRVALGGWADFEYRQDLTSNQSVFDQHHLAPFISARVTDELRVAAEVELVHAPRLDANGTTTSGAGTLVVDYATVDYHLADPFSLRGGVILSPVGRYNLLRETPLQDFTAPPLIADQLLPGPLGETGIGAFGSVAMSPALLTYEAYVVNGFTSALIPTAGQGTLVVSPDMIGTRGAAESSTKNVVGRLAISPFRGLEIGGSAHWGPYGDGVAKNTEKHDATLWAVDGAFDRGFLVVRGEMANLHADLPAAVAATGASNGRQGYYAELGVRFGSGWLPPFESSRFTITGRWDDVDLATGIAGDVLRRASAGLVWRPVAIAAFKGSYEWNWVVPENATRMQTAPSRLLFSATTYF